MDFIPIEYGASDWLPSILIFAGLLLVGVGLCYLFDEKFFLGFLSIFGLILAIAAAGNHVSVHGENQKNDIKAALEEAFGMTIIEGDPPYYPNKPPSALVVALDDAVGVQSVVIEIKDNEYVVTYNGEKREVQND